VDHDRLVLLALGEAVTDAMETDHLGVCAGCQGDLEALRAVADLGRETQDLLELPAPPDRVWRRIAATTGVATRTGTANGTWTANGGLALATGRFSPAPADTGRVRRAWPGWARAAVVAAAAAILAVAGTLGAVRVVDSQPADQVAATADLAPLPLAPAGSQGVATVLVDADGERLHVHVSGMPLQPGYYEVWLINPDTFEMVSVGLLRDGADALLPLPSTIDLREYRLVDVSAEDYDGDATHSGRSMLRGTLAG
jgi:hypothetical protein